jgi:hypothetical protein
MGEHDFAAFTITRNEPLFLRVWLNYMTKVFPPEDVYVINNSTTDGSVEEARALHPTVNFVFRDSPVAHVSLFLKGTVEAFQRELLQRYRVVVFSETDEYLIPSTRYAGLLDYCQQFNDDPTSTRRRAQGWNVVQQIDTEPAVRREPGASLLEARNSMWLLPTYDKTLITKKPIVYQKGFHNFFDAGVKQVDEPIDVDLALLHAWRVDIDEYVNRHSGRFLDLNKATASEYFRTHKAPWVNEGDPHAVGPETPVPDHWRSLLTY